MKQQSGTSWEMPGRNEERANGTAEGRKHEEERLELAARVLDVHERRGWNKSEISRRADMAVGTFNQWYSGKYEGRIDPQNRKISNWLDTVDEMEAIEAGIPESPPYLPMEFATEISDALKTAQIMPALVMISAEAGLGKTICAKRHASASPNTFMVTMSPYTRTVPAMLVEIAEELGIPTGNRGKIFRLIGKRLQSRGAETLLIVDEAQNLSDEAINQIRHLVDIYKCGVALLGNTETYSRFSNWAVGPKYGQLRRRFFKRVRRDKPYDADLDAFIKAQGVTDRKQRDYLFAIGRKPGALGQIDMTVKLAKMLAIAEEGELQLDHLKAAWSNRDVGDGRWPKLPP